MMEFGNVVSTLYAASAIKQTHLVKDAGEEDEKSQSEVMLQILLDSEVRSFGSLESKASGIIGKVQEILASTRSIADNMVLIRQILEELRTAMLTPEIDAPSQIAERIQEWLQEMEEVIEKTKVDGNAILGPEGNDWEISIGNGSVITIQTEDLSLDPNAVDLTTAEGMEEFWAAVDARLSLVTEYESQIFDQLARLNSATQIIETQIDETLGIDSSQLTPETAMTAATVAASQVVAMMNPLYDTDALDGDIVASLLADDA